MISPVGLVNDSYSCGRKLNQVPWNVSGRGAQRVKSLEFPLFRVAVMTSSPRETDAKALCRGPAAPVSTVTAV